MFRRTLGITTLALAAAAAPTRADIMHWFWEVEVNGEAVDSGQPVVVAVGDRVDIALWAEFDPYRAGFSASVFAIDVDPELFVAGAVNIDEASGFGRNPLLAELSDRSGTPTDTDNDGALDSIDDIEVWQLPMFWEDNGDWRDPLPIYAIHWDVLATPTTPIQLERGATSDGRVFSTVYWDIYGNSSEYDELNTPLVIVPTPGTSLMGVVAIGAACRRVQRYQRAQGRI